MKWRSHTNSTGKQSNVVNYDTNVTHLFRSLENRRWDEAIHLCELNPSQSSTWVYRLDRNSLDLRWKMLPLHAALIFKGNDLIIDALIKAYPAAVRLADDQGMLPLHLAFLKDMSETTINRLISLYPESINSLDKEGRTPFMLMTRQSVHDGSAENFLRLYFTTLIKERDLRIESMQRENIELRNKLEDARKQLGRRKRDEANRIKKLELEKLLVQEKAKSSSLGNEIETKTHYAHSILNGVSALKVSQEDKLRAKEEIEGVNEQLDGEGFRTKGRVQALKKELDRKAKCYEALALLYGNEKYSIKTKISSLQDSFTKIKKEYEVLKEKHTGQIENFSSKDRKLRESLQSIIGLQELSNLHDYSDRCVNENPELRDENEHEESWDSIIRKIEQMKENFDALSVMYEEDRKEHEDRIIKLQQRVETCKDANTKLTQVIEDSCSGEEEIEDLMRELNRKTEEINSINLERNNFISKVGRLEGMLDESRKKEKLLEKTKSDFSRYLEKIMTEICSLEKVFANDKVTNFDTVTKIELKVEAAVQSMKYLTVKCQDLNTMADDYKKLQSDMDELLSINRDLRNNISVEKRNDLSTTKDELEGELNMAPVPAPTPKPTPTPTSTQEMRTQEDRGIAVENMESMKQENCKPKNELSIGAPFHSMQEDGQTQMMMIKKITSEVEQNSMYQVRSGQAIKKEKALNCNTVEVSEQSPDENSVMESREPEETSTMFTENND